ADQELHRQVVDPLRVLALVGFLGTYPSLGQNVAYGASEGLEAFAWARGRGSDDAVEHEMALIEPIGASRELNRAAAVLPEKICQLLVVPGAGAGGYLRRLSHLRHPFGPRTLIGGVAPRMTVSLNGRITGQDSSRWSPARSGGQSGEAGAA